MKMSWECKENVNKLSWVTPNEADPDHNLGFCRNLKIAREHLK